MFTFVLFVLAVVGAFVGGVFAGPSLTALWVKDSPVLKSDLAALEAKITALFKGSTVTPVVPPTTVVTPITK